MNEIMAVQSADMFMPIMNIEVAIQRRKYLTKFVSEMLVEGHDFGKIPGAGDKPTLLKPGSEKLATFFGLTPVFVLQDHVEDWTGSDHNGEPFFYYRYKCELWRMGNLIATSEGSCNSHEVKYRYRKGERVCPQCGATAIIKGKAEYGGGWLCFGKRGGCGAKFQEGDPSIVGQETGRILNPDVADQVNTLQKMSQKRSLIASVLLAVNASEFFTQDIEDMADFIDATATVVESTPAAQAKEHRQSRPPAQAQPAAAIIPGERCAECNAPNGKPHASSCSHRVNGNGKPPADEPRPPLPPAAEFDAAVAQSSAEDGERLMADAPTPDEALRINAVEIIDAAAMKTPADAKTWAVKNGYRTSEQSAATKWAAMVNAEFEGKLTMPKMRDALVAYVELCLIEGKKEMEVV